MQCTNCKSEILATAKFCPECGNKVENQGKTCQNKQCNRTGLPNEALFCPDCGTMLDKEENTIKRNCNILSFESFNQPIYGIGFKMIAVKGGIYMMGFNGVSTEMPVHEANVPDFFIAETQVTQEIYQMIMGINPSVFSDDIKRPVLKGSYYDFILKLNRVTGKEFRLPTETEWEYAARGGQKSKGFIYSGSNNVEEVAWFKGNSNNMTHPVGLKMPNELGIYDMSGNVWEICADDHQDGYKKYPNDGTAFIKNRISDKVLRGGSWISDKYFCRNSDRNYYKSGEFRYTVIGISLALSLKK